MPTRQCWTGGRSTTTSNPQPIRAPTSGLFFFAERGAGALPIPNGRSPPCAARWPHVRWRCRQHAQAVETFKTAARFAVLVASFSGRTRVHPPHPQGTDLPCGRESLGCHTESPHGYPSHPRTRSEERHEGKECVSTC